MPTIDPWGWCHERQPCATRVNAGLVLNDATWRAQLARQDALVANVAADLAWVERYYEVRN